MNIYRREDVYRIQLISRKLLEEYVLTFKYVPYRLNRHSKYEVGHTYWNSYWERVYTVLEVNGSKVKIQWQDNGSIVEHMTSLDTKRDYELKPFEYRLTSTLDSYSSAEIKALIYNGHFRRDVVESLINKYYITDHTPNDYTYYFIFWNDDTDGLKVNLRRDLIKSPHNFYNIKTLEDVIKDHRISHYTMIDVNDKIIPFGSNVLYTAPVLDIKYIPKEGYKVKLDCIQIDGIHIGTRIDPRNEVMKRYRIN